MSILYEAWRRAHGGDRRLAGTLGAPAVAFRGRSPLLPWLLCLLLVALAAGLGVYVWLVHSRPPADGTRSSVAAPLPQAAKPAEPPRLHAAGALEGAKPKAVAAAPPPASATMKSVSGESPHAGPAAEHRDAAVMARASVTAAHSGRKAGGAGKKAAHASIAAAPPEPVPFASAPDDIRERFPALGIVAHIWNPDQDARFIMIGSRVYRAGDEIASGVRLVEITRNGEIVAFRGYRLILQ